MTEAASLGSCDFLGREARGREFSLFAARWDRNPEVMLLRLHDFMKLRPGSRTYHCQVVLLVLCMPRAVSHRRYANMGPLGPGVAILHVQYVYLVRSLLESLGSLSLLAVCLVSAVPNNLDMHIPAGTASRCQKYAAHATFKKKPKAKNQDEVEILSAWRTAFY